MKVTWLVLPAALLLAASAGFGQKQISDDQIYDQVRLKLAADRDVGGANFEVDVKDGVVTLRGKVDRERNRQRAERLVKKVKGVRQVVNQLRVDPPGRG